MGALSKWMGWRVVLAISTATWIVFVGLAGSALTAAAIDLAGAKAKARFVDREGASKDRGFVRLGRDSRITAPLPNPTTLPSEVRVFSETSGVTRLPLDPTRWRSVRRGYRYNDPNVESGVRTIALLHGARGGSIVIRSRGSVLGMQPVSDPSDFLEIRLGIGSEEYCARVEPPDAQVTTSRPDRLAFSGTASPCAITETICTVDNASSGVHLELAAANVIVPASGEVTFTCDAVDPTSMQAACQCDLDLGPSIILGLGELCFAPGPACQAGVLDCAGTSAADADLVADRLLASCTDNADCASQCDAHCSQLGAEYARSFSACQGFCSGGSNDGGTCTQESDCPGGFCAGPDFALTPNQCQCTCTGRDLGAPGAPSLSCDASITVSLETDGSGVCGDGPPILILPPVCQRMTTTSTTGVIDDANEQPGVSIGPSSLAGSLASCAALPAGSAAATIVGQQAGYGTQLGDVLLGTELTCTP